MRFVAEQVVPASRQMPGWKGVLGLASADGRRGLTLTFWDSLEALAASSHDAGQFRGAGSTVGMDVVSSERLEVVLDERPE
jgi:heme-degrading monooxygenase HmoA